MAETASSTIIPTRREDVPHAVAERMKATLFGQCVGDTLGLLTEFLTKEEAKRYYGKKTKSLVYGLKVPDFHRMRWEIGDWTDDTDHMILILQSVLYHRGEVNKVDFAKRMRRWMNKGFPELGDLGGMGIGRTTQTVLNHPEFITEPHDAAFEIWDKSQRNLAANGAVMRTSVLGLHQWNDIEKVVENALRIVKCTHADPRCQASVVAVSTCIALMIQRTTDKQGMAAKSKTKSQPIDDIIQQSYDLACRVLETEDQKKELWKHMTCKKLKHLELCEPGKIGYTYKCMGSGFWALRQDNFEKAMIKLVMEGGDADTNGAVAGAMLACKLGLDAIPDRWISELRHKDMMLDLFNKFVKLQSEMSLPIDERTSNNDLSIENLDIIGEQYKQKKEQDRIKKEEGREQSEKKKDGEQEETIKDHEQEEKKKDHEQSEKKKDGEQEEKIKDGEQEETIKDHEQEEKKKDHEQEEKIKDGEQEETIKDHEQEEKIKDGEQEQKEKEHGQG